MIFQINGTFSDCQNSTESGRSREEDIIRVLQKLRSEEIAVRENTQFFQVPRSSLFGRMTRQTKGNDTQLHNIWADVKTFSGRDGSTTDQSCKTAIRLFNDSIK